MESMKQAIMLSTLTMYLVRTTRARIIRLRNDYKDLMAAIEKFLHQHFASLQDAPEPPPSAGAPPVLPDSQPDLLDGAFARVNTVAAGSPAETAGLKPGDEIRNFGYVNRSNHDNLKKVGECVQGNEGVSFGSAHHHLFRELNPHRETSSSGSHAQPPMWHNDKNCG